MHRWLAWALRQREKGKANKELAILLGIKVRRFQQLLAEYRKTGLVPRLKTMRRPKIELTDEENRHKFKSVGAFIEWYNKRIHLGLSRKKGIPPLDAARYKLNSTSILGLFFRLNEK